MSKGTVYGGVLYLPQHPYADIHGLLRAVMRTKGWRYVIMELERFMLNPSVLIRNHIWAESGSAVEKIVTETHYGEMLVCPLVEAYLKPERYTRLLPESLKQETAREVHSSVNRTAYPKAYQS